MSLSAAIYARKSTDQGGTVDEQKSVARQVDHARRFAEGRGWQVLDTHIYVDDGLSGAEFERRPAFLRMTNALKPRASFDVIVMSEESRLRREAIETRIRLSRFSPPESPCSCIWRIVSESSRRQLTSC